MTQEELKKEFLALFDTMASSNKVEHMYTFGRVMKEMMMWVISYKPDLAQEWIGKLESVRWKNYLTPKEAETIVSSMKPSAPWSREVWKQRMERSEYPLGHGPHYNSCALWVAMCMKMSDSGKTLEKYVSEEDIFNIAYDLAVDSLTDEDEKFSIRRYFGV